MDRWLGKVCVVTGASAGIGSAICVALANAGLTVIGLARRAHLVEKLQSSVNGPGSGKVVARHCDVSSSGEVEATFKWIEQEYGCIHALINNAGIMNSGNITDVGDEPLTEEQLLATIDVNLKGPIMCTKRAVSCMIRHKFDGHIININSIAGHYIPFSPKFNVYSSSKHGLTALNAALLNELGHFKSRIKVTSISPGLTATELVSQETIDECGWPALQSADIADAVVYVLSTPPHVNINELTISPVTELRL